MEGIATKHEVLVDKAKYAIEQIAGDTSVSPQQTIESLGEIKEQIEETVNAICEDLDIAEKEGDPT